MHMAAMAIYKYLQIVGMDLTSTSLGLLVRIAALQTCLSPQPLEPESHTPNLTEALKASICKPG